MATYYISFESRALPGRDDDYHRWYDEVHIGDVLAIPGFKRLAARYRIVNEEPQARWISVFEIDGDPNAALAGVGAARGTMAISDALDLEYIKIDVLEAKSV